MTRDVPDEARSRKSLLLGGLRLLVANSRLLLWLWLASFFCGLTGTIPFSRPPFSRLNHSLAAQEIAGRVDLGYLAELMLQAGKRGGIDSTPSMFSIVVFTIVSVVFASGALFVFISGTPARLSNVADAGLRYFWRFIRLTILAAITFGLTFWLLSTLRDAWLNNAGKIHVGAAIFWRSALSFAAMLLIALLVRFYFDLAEAVIVQIGITGDRRVRRSFPIAFSLLRTNFFRSFGSYFVAGTLGVALSALALWLWVDALSPHSNALAFLLGQLGVAALLAGRLWQRASLAFLLIRNAATISDTAITPMPDTAELRTIW